MTRMNADNANLIMQTVFWYPRPSVLSVVVADAYVHQRNRATSFETDVSNG
jgi:hypothetical protein